MELKKFKRFTTDTHSIALGFDPALISKVRIAYIQNGVTAVAKEFDASELDGDTVTVTLTQEDTAKFKDDKDNRDVEIQIRVLTLDGECFAADAIDACMMPMNDAVVMT